MKYTGGSPTPTDRSTAAVNLAAALMSLQVKLPVSYGLVCDIDATHAARSMRRKGTAYTSEVFVSA